MAPATKPASRVSKRILVIDDNIDHVRSLALLFDSMGHHVDYAINATVAVDIAVRMEPDIIFLDILLPDDHGAGVCAELRKHSVLRNTTIIAITGSTRMTDHQLVLDAGCTDVLRKPIAPEVYERLIAGGATRRKLREIISRDDPKPYR